MGTMPLFAAAPRVHLQIGNHSLAYAIGFNFNLSVDVTPVYAIGQYNAVALEPTYHNVVTGTIQIQRLSHSDARTANIKGADLFTKNALSGANVPSNATAWNGDSLNSTNSSTSDLTGVGNTNPVLGSPGTLFAHLDPSSVLLSQLFDMDVYLAVQNGVTAAKEVVDAQKNPITQFDKNGNLQTEVTQSLDTGSVLTHWFSIKGCRITSRNTNITFGQIVNEPVSFNGLLAVPYANGAALFTADDGLKDG